MVLDHSKKQKKQKKQEYKNPKKQEAIQFYRNELESPKFNIILYIHISKISQEEANLTKYYAIRHLASKPKYDVYQREIASMV